MGVGIRDGFITSRVSKIHGQNLAGASRFLLNVPRKEIGMKSLKKVVLAALLGLSMLSGAAMAALPAAVGTTVTAIQADGQAVFDLVFPVVGVFIGLAIVIKLFKRFSNKV